MRKTLWRVREGDNTNIKRHYKHCKDVLFKDIKSHSCTIGDENLEITSNTFEESSLSKDGGGGALHSKQASCQSNLYTYYEYMLTLTNSYRILCFIVLIHFSIHNLFSLKYTKFQQKKTKYSFPHYAYIWEDGIEGGGGAKKTMGWLREGAPINYDGDHKSRWARELEWEWWRVGEGDERCG